MTKRTFDYTANDLRNPRGSNSLSSEALFYQRSLYKEAIYPITPPTPLDTWYRSVLFGKVDRYQNTIMLRNDKLKRFPGSTDVAIDFVVDAFEGFKNHIRAAGAQGKLNGTTSGIISDMSVRGGWESPEKPFALYLQNLFSGFLNHYVVNHHNEITNFKTFVPHMKRFLLQTCQKVPVTRTNYMLTRFISRRSSGLVVRIGSFEASDDNVKYEEFISNPNFDVYRTCAKKYGFLVDKNMPWLLTADITSKAMSRYMKNYIAKVWHGDGSVSTEPITSNNFFSNYYNLVCDSDISILKRLFKNFYNQYIKIFPFYEETTRPCQDCPHKTKVTQHYRKSTTIGEVDKYMTDLDWIRFYIDLREGETQGTRINVNLFKSRIREVYREGLKPTGALEWARIPTVFEAERKAVLAINRLYRNYLYTPAMLNLILSS